MSQQVLDYLNNRPDASEAAEITTYEVFIGNRPVTVRVRDSGASAGQHRFAVEAAWTTIDERTPLDTGFTLGNAEPSLEAALDNVHWWNFDPKND